MFHLDRISRQFGRQVLFEDLSWMIPRGARLGLVGANGTGKTTLMRILSGRERPDSGASHKPQTAKVGYLPQEVERVGGGSVLSVVLAGFEEISRLESELQQLERRLTLVEAGDPDGERLTAEYGELRHRFESLEGDRLESKAKVILSGLGVPTSRFHEPVENLSGGWRMRVVLARLLLGAPELLLLDEPTNHLDLEAIDWLEQFLASYAGAFVIVSHDRYFLNRMVQEIVDLERGRLTHYAGNYDAYIAAREGQAAALDKAARQQAREVARVERFIERFRYKNTKAKQVQSRVRALGKLERVSTERGGKSIRFGFPPAPRSGDVAVRAEGVDKRFGSKVVYDSMELLLRREDRMALVGPNGAGKTTLLKMLAGRTPVDGGRLELGHNVAIHYYAQHQLDALDPQATVLQEMERVAPADQRPRLRKLLGGFLFRGEDVDKKVGVLSGGEKARLALARMLLRPSNLLLLDEPTNHLDLRSREVLEQALNEYAGTLVVVSHDRYFINRVATSIGEVGGGRIHVHAGDYDEYMEWKRRRSEREETPAHPHGEPSGGRSRREDKRAEAEERNRRYRERRLREEQLGPVEAEVARLEERARELEVLQAAEPVYSDPDRAREVGREKAEVEQHLERLYAQWEALAAALDDPDG